LRGQQGLASLCWFKMPGEVPVLPRLPAERKLRLP
jgi:hypothetical protein